MAREAHNRKTLKFLSTSFVTTSMVTPVDSPKPVEQDFAEIYRTHYRRVFGLCRYLLNSADAAEDATHEAFLRAQRKFAGYDHSQPLSSWLLAIASHHCIDVLRRRRLETRLFELNSFEDLDPAARGPSPLSEILAAERSGAVRGALAALPDKFRIPLVLAYYNDLGYDEIAGILGLKRTHVATLLFRAKHQMRRILAGQENRHGLS
jgi:RNA polymerase sigma-70 factor (ECF subfamily)